MWPSIPQPGFSEGQESRVGTTGLRPTPLSHLPPAGSNMKLPQHHHMDMVFPHGTGLYCFTAAREK